MKPLYIVCTILFTFITTLIFDNHTYAQCTLNQPPQSISYDTTVAGTGNDQFVFTFPQFDPTLGTLTSVKFETSVTLLYSFQLENNNFSSAEQRVRITRTDEITYPWDQIDRTNNKNLGPYHLAGSDGTPGSGPDYVEDGPLYAFQNLLNTYNITDNVVPFLGNGTVEVDYNTESFANAIGNLNSTLTGQAQDMITFKITYFYCSTTFLAVDIMQFAATRLTNGDVQLSWLTPNDYSGKKYEIEKSSDGRSFTTLQLIVTGNTPSTGKQAVYHPGKEDKNRIFFRVRQFEADGTFRYSSIRDFIIISDETGMKVYPTLATNAVNISFPSSAKGDYKVSIISTTGQLMQQSEFSKTNLFRVSFNRKLPTGMYLVTVYNKKTMETKESKIVVQ